LDEGGTVDVLFVLTGYFIQAAIPTAVVVGGVVIVSKTEIGRALVQRLRGGRGDAQVQQLAADVDALRDELVDMHERLDVTERLLARSERRPVVPPGGTDGDR
jgi:hypothetical protein